MSEFLFGVVGLGGYAGAMVDLVLRCQREGLAPVRLAAICEPDPAKAAAKRDELESAGVKIHTRLDDFLREPVEMVWLPLPIELHRSYTEKVLAAGKSVLCEKPAAGCIQDVDGMIAARDRAGLRVTLGFHDLYAPATWRLKDELLAGAIGRVHAATVYATWPRDSVYYNRNGWAGALQRNGVWVLDSPANNALAHYIHMALFWLGTARAQPAQLQQVEAELYRANAIENYDTCALRLTTATGARLLIYLTHVCAQNIDPIIELHGEHGTARYESGGRLQIRRAARAGETTDLPQGDCRVHMLRHAIRHVRGEDIQEVSSLEIARPHSLAMSGASDSARVAQIAEQYVQTRDLGDGRTRREIPGIEPALRECCQRQILLHESGLVPWSRPAGTLDLQGYSQFTGRML